MKRDPKKQYTSEERDYHTDHGVSYTPQSGKKIQNVNSTVNSDSALIKTHVAASGSRTGRRTDNIAAKSRSGSQRRISDSSKRTTVVLKPSTDTDSGTHYETGSADSVQNAGKTQFQDASDLQIDSAEDIRIKNDNLSVAELLDSAESNSRRGKYSYQSPRSERTPIRSSEYSNNRDRGSANEIDYEQGEIRGPKQSSSYGRSSSRYRTYAAAAAAGRTNSRRESRSGDYYGRDSRYYDKYDRSYYDDDEYYDIGDRRKGRKRISGFKIFLIIYSCFLLLVIAAGFIVFRVWAAAYEKTQPYNVAADVAETFSDDEKLEDFLLENSDKTNSGQDISDLIDDFVSYVSGKTISYSENSNYLPNAPSYNIMADGSTVAQITLAASGEKSFGLTSWKISSIMIGESANLTSYLIYAPEDSEIIVNGTAVDKSFITSEAEIPEILNAAAQFVNDIPEFVTYTIPLAETPEIKATDSSGEALSVRTSENGTFVVGCEASDEFINSVESIVYAAITEWGEYFIRMGFGLKYYIHPDCDWYAYIFGSDDMDPIYTAFYDYEYIDTYEFSVKNAANYVKYADDCFTVDISYKIDITFTTENRSDDNQKLDATWVFVPEPGGDGWVIVDCIYNSDSTSGQDETQADEG